MFLKAVISEMQMYKLKFFDGAFLTFFILCQTCTVQNACKNRAVGPGLQGGQSFPPIFWHKQKKYLLLQKALDYYLPPPPQIFRPSYGSEKMQALHENEPTHACFVSQQSAQFPRFNIDFFFGPTSKMDPSSYKS